MRRRNAAICAVGALLFLYAMGSVVLAEVEETDKAVIYRSEPDESQSEMLEEERYKQDMSWEMLRNMTILPRRREWPETPLGVDPQSN